MRWPRYCRWGAVPASWRPDVLGSMSISSSSSSLNRFPEDKQGCSEQEHHVSQGNLRTTSPREDLCLNKIKKNATISEPT